MTQLELTVARTLARCGGTAGALKLTHYVGDVREVFAGHALSELRVLTGRDFGRNIGEWQSWLGEHGLEPAPYKQNHRL